MTILVPCKARFPEMVLGLEAVRRKLSRIPRVKGKVVNPKLRSSVQNGKGGSAFPACTASDRKDARLTWTFSGLWPSNIRATSKGPCGCTGATWP